MRSLLFVSALVCAGGCGLVLDVDPSSAPDAAVTRDAAPVDASVDAAVSVDDGGLEDAGLEDAGPPCALPARLRLPLDREPVGAPVPDAYPTECGDVAAFVEGGPDARAEAALASRSGDATVLWLTAPPGEEMAIALDFGRVVTDVVIGMEWLSFEPARQIEERLTLGADGVEVVPTLETSAGAYVERGEVRATSAKSDARIHVERAQVLKIVLRNLGPGDGLGIELHDLEVTAPAAAP